MKTIKLILLTALCLTFAVTLGALAAPGDVTILDNDNINSMTVIGDNVYLATYDSKIYRYQGDALTAYTYENEQSGGYMDVNCLLTDGQKLYALIIGMWQEEDGSKSGVENALIYTVNINDDLTAVFSDPIELDWDDMVETYDNYEYSREVQYPFIQDGKFVFTTYGYNSNEIMVYDLQSGAAEVFENEKTRQIGPYKDGRALIATCDYNQDNPPMVYSAFDLITGDVQPLMEIPVENYVMPENFVYDTKNDRLYYVMAGELYRADGMDIKTVQSVASVPLDSGANKTPFILDNGNFAAYDYQRAIIRNTDPSLRGATKLTVQNLNGTSSINEAYTVFQNAHRDVEVVLTDRFSGDLLQAMMSRSTNVDIYSINTANDQFQTLYDRGYLAELGESETLVKLINEMYPVLRDAVTKDGAPLALPLDIYSYCSSINTAVLEKLGLTVQNLPETWLELATFIHSLEGKFDDTDVSLFDPYMTAENARTELIYTFIYAYMSELASGERDGFTFDTPQFRDTLKAFEQIDYEALGLPEEQSDSYVYYADTVLLETYTNMNAYNRRRATGDNRALLPLAVAEGMNKRIDTNCTLMFVNPFSQNRQLAVEFLECVADSLSDDFLIHVCPGRNEPIPNPSYQESAAHYESTIESLKKDLEEAPDDEKEAYRLNVEDYERYYEEFKQNGMWSVSADAIAEYRKYAEYMSLERSIGMDAENSQEFNAQLRQYMDGAIDVDTFIRNVDKKLKMMLMEGM